MATSRSDSSDELLDGVTETPYAAGERYRKAREKLTSTIFFEYDHNKKYKEIAPLIKIAKQIVKDADDVYDASIFNNSDHLKVSDLADSLECVLEAIEHPENHHNFKRISTLAGSADTQASVGKKVAAGLILVAGILTILAFGALVLATKGVALAALPVLGPAITVGLGWLAAAATTLGMSSTLLAGIGLGIGVGATAIGAGIAADGQAKGLAKSMHNFHNELNRHRKKTGVSEEQLPEPSLVF